MAWPIMKVWPITKVVVVSLNQATTEAVQAAMIADGDLVMESSGRQIIAFFTDWQKVSQSDAFPYPNAVKCATLWRRQILNQLGAKLLLSLLLLLNCLSFHSLAMSNMVGHVNLIAGPHSTAW